MRTADGDLKFGGGDMEECYINRLRRENEYMRRRIKEFANRFYCIGHPLNDNALCFNKKQLEYLQKFATEMDFCLGELDGKPEC